ncbi:MAG: Wzz/FepE/Etk N-terminal domain-containing protein [Anaerolineae bacterium]
MNLTEYGRILFRRGWIILLLLIIAAGSAYGFSRFITPTYRATQIVLVTPSRNDLGLTEAIIRLLNSYRSYLDSREIAADVINRLQLDMTPDQLKGDVVITVGQIDLSIHIDVDSEDPDLANRIAREWGQQLVEYRVQQNQTVRNEDRVDAMMPDQPRVDLLQPRPTLNAVAGAVLGLILGIIIVFVLEYLESSIVRNREDLERNLDLPVLATVPRIEG